MTDDAAVEAVARAIAEELYPFDECHRHKAHWVETGGMLNGSFRDVNGPFQSDYLDMARAAIAANTDAKDAEIDRLRALVDHYEKMVGHPNRGKSMATRHDPHKMKSATTQED